MANCNLSGHEFIQATIPIEFVESGELILFCSVCGKVIKIDTAKLPAVNVNETQEIEAH